MQHLVQNSKISFNNWKEAIWSLTKKKENNKEKVINRIIRLDGENSKKVEWQHDIGLRNFA